MNKNTYLSLALTILGLAVLIPSTSFAQTEAPSWNRMVEAVSIMPTSSSTGQQAVTAFFSVDARDIAEPTDLSTDLDLVVNGEVVGSQSFDIMAYPAGTAAFGCNNCGPDQPCLVLNGIAMGCINSFLCDPLWPSLNEDDLVEVRLSPGRDAEGDTERGDDAGVLFYQGQATLATASACAGQQSATVPLTSACSVGKKSAANTLDR